MLRSDSHATVALFFNIDLWLKIMTMSNICQIRIMDGIMDNRDPLMSPTLCDWRIILDSIYSTGSVSYGCMHTWYRYALDFRSNGCTYYRSPYTNLDGSVWCFCNGDYCNGDLSLIRLFTTPTRRSLATQHTTLPDHKLDINGMRHGWVNDHPLRGVTVATADNWESGSSSDIRKNRNSVNWSYYVTNTARVSRDNGGNNIATSHPRVGSSSTVITLQPRNHHVTSRTSSISGSRDLSTSGESDQGRNGAVNEPTEPLEVHVKSMDNTRKQQGVYQTTTTTKPVNNINTATNVYPIAITVSTNTLHTTVFNIVKKQTRLEPTTVPMIIMSRDGATTSDSHSKDGDNVVSMATTPRGTRNNGYAQSEYGIRRYERIDVLDCGRVYKPSTSDKAEKFINGRL